MSDPAHCSPGIEQACRDYLRDLISDLRQWRQGPRNDPQVECTLVDEIRRVWSIRNDIGVRVHYGVPYQLDKHAVSGRDNS